MGMQGINFEDRQLHKTDDGSFTLAINGGSETYHSRRGAHSESQHVFVEKGFKPLACEKDLVNVLEIGFGTGLNALLTLRTLMDQFPNLKVNYTALEPHPLHVDEVAALGYFEPYERAWLYGFHSDAFKGGYAPHENFLLRCHTIQLSNFQTDEASFDVVYYDAFGPATQPEMWTTEAFSKIMPLVRIGGALVTYCAKGQVRRDLEAVGFQAERLDGPPGKREMLRAWKK